MKEYKNIKVLRLDRKSIITQMFQHAGRINFCSILIVLIGLTIPIFPKVWWLIELHLSFLALLFQKDAPSSLFWVFL